MAPSGAIFVCSPVTLASIADDMARR